MKKEDLNILLRQFNEEEIKIILADAKSFSDAARKIFGCKSTLCINAVKELFTKYCVETPKYFNKKVYCLNCGKEITGKDRNRRKFCCQTCNGLYNNRIKFGLNKTNTYSHCLNCGKEIPYGHKYCNNVCKNEYEYKQYILRWKKGEENGLKGVDDISNNIVRYLRDKYNNQCQLCGWHQENKYTHKIPLQVHHIDGDCTNNKEDNLQLLCPNCHSLTETFGALNKGKSKRQDKRLR